MSAYLLERVAEGQLHRAADGTFFSPGLALQDRALLRQALDPRDPVASALLTLVGLAPVQEPADAGSVPR